MIKKLTYVALALSGLMLAYLFIWDRAFVDIPIDQRECPPNVGVAPDGTCGIYISEPSIWLIISGLIALLGLILLVVEVIRRKKAYKNKNS